MTPIRRPGAEPLVQIDPGPAYELLQGIVTVVDSDDDDTYDVGAEWLAEMRARIGDDLLSEIRRVSFDNPDVFTNLTGLAYETPAPRDVPAFLEHLRATDALEVKLHLVEFYTREARRMTPLSVMRAAVAGDPDARDEFLRTSHPEYEPWTHFLGSVLQADAEELKRSLLDVLTAFHDRAWKAEALTIQPIVERDAAAKRAMLAELPLEDFVRTATNGVEFAPRPGIERVVMIPSFVRRPTRQSPPPPTSRHAGWSASRRPWVTRSGCASCGPSPTARRRSWSWRRCSASPRRRCTTT
jgi:hypothetical protein